MIQKFVKNIFYNLLINIILSQVNLNKIINQKVCILKTINFIDNNDYSKKKLFFCARIVMFDVYNKN